MFNLRASTTCRCRACRNAGSLDLKFFLHYDDFLVTGTGGRRDLSGPAVILLHRLMKNRVTDAIGSRAYLLATADALNRLGHPAGFAPHHEKYEHFGAVELGVADLHAALEARRAAREVRVTPERAVLTCEAVVAAPPAVVWDCFFDP